MNEHYPFLNPPLPYAYNAMEPYIDTKTMKLHHDRHLQTYVDNLNHILADYPDYQMLSLEQLLMNTDSLPLELRTPIRNNAGGVFNHLFYFSLLKNPGVQAPPKPLSAYINADFGDFTSFMKAFAKTALSVFGSGYAWLVLDCFQHLRIVTTANQDTPLPLQLRPLLCLDVWEHAYYLKHFNKRADYIADWFSIINWEQVNRSLRG